MPKASHLSMAKQKRMQRGRHSTPCNTLRRVRTDGLAEEHLSGPACNQRRRASSSTATKSSSLMRSSRSDRTRKDVAVTLRLEPKRLERVCAPVEGADGATVELMSLKMWPEVCLSSNKFFLNAS
mmetsp:Transcript_24655/g.64751  ORF Transcript_24655/g.64751 Transcript_24655/m.64751 type:complete len:125 (+) Transcript_24655:427-801(+)